MMNEKQIRNKMYTLFIKKGVKLGSRDRDKIKRIMIEHAESRPPEVKVESKFKAWPETEW
jgi:hypothetical protein